jgi:ribosome-binding factor A
MSQGSRPSRVADQIRAELADLLMREVHDPGIGFVTLTRVQVSPDLQSARVYYTTLGDDAARRGTARALERAARFLRHRVGTRLRLRRVPQLRFLYDESIAGQDRIEQLLNELHADPADQASDIGPTAPPYEGEAPVPSSTGRPLPDSTAGVTPEHDAAKASADRGTGAPPEANDAD